MPTTSTRVLLAAACLSVAGSASALNIEFDYSYDNGSVMLSDGQKSILDTVAAQFGARITDTLDAATYGTITFYDPGEVATANSLVSERNVSIASDTIRVYAAAAQLGGSTLAAGGPGGGNVNNRGETEVGTTDFAPWGGQISFDIRNDWYVDTDVSTDESFGGFDFYSVAMHELTHVLGFGTSASWDSQVTSGTFAGKNSVAAYGSAVALNGNAHWASGTTSFVDGVSQQAALTAVISSGSRKYMTDLDWAALSDVGWQVAAAVPEPESWAMMLAGLGLLGLTARRRMRPSA